MATVAFTKVDNLLDQAIFTWPALANGDSGDVVQFSGSGDKSIQVNGTFGAGGTIVIEGSLDGTNYYTLTDALGNALSLTAAGLKSVGQHTVYIRPRVSAGDVNTALTVTLGIRRFFR